MPTRSQSRIASSQSSSQVAAESTVGQGKSKAHDAFPSSQATDDGQGNELRRSQRQRKDAVGKEQDESELSDPPSPAISRAKNNVSRSRKKHSDKGKGREVSKGGKGVKGQQMRYDDSDASTYHSPSEEEDEKDSDFSVKKKKSSQREGKHSSHLRMPPITTKDDKKARDEASKFEESLLATKSLIREIEKASKTFKVKYGSEPSSTPVLAYDIKVCPFCNEKMPRGISKKLEAAMQVALDKYHAGITMSRVQTMDLCNMHQQEGQIIPDGLKRGWIKKLDVESLKHRILHGHFMDTLRHRIEAPTSSDWFTSLKAQRSEMGKRADGIAGQMRHINDMHAGYYGERGLEAMHQVLSSSFLQNHRDHRYNLEILSASMQSPFAPLSAQDFIYKVLTPELVCMLIQDDVLKKTKKTISLNDAKKIRDESHKYGSAMFPSLNADEESAMKEKRAKHLNIVDDEELQAQNPRNSRRRSTSTKLSSSQGGTMSASSQEDHDNRNRGTCYTQPIPMASQKRRKVAGSASSSVPTSSSSVISQSPSRPKPRASRTHMRDSSSGSCIDLTLTQETAEKQDLSWIQGHSSSKGARALNGLTSSSQPILSSDPSTDYPSIYTLLSDSR